jgi:hypothetical protein
MRELAEKEVAIPGTDKTFIWKSVSKTEKDHRFFDKFLDNDLESLKLQLIDRYQKIQSGRIPGVGPIKPNEAWRESNSVSTMKWREYNVFQFYSKEIYSLYTAVGEMVREACEYYEIDFDAQDFMIQGWFNINEAHNGKLDWHDHGPDGAPNFHGYYSVSAEPSKTHYLVFDKEVENNNLNNRAILSEMGHPHAMGDWDWDGPRITIAYDVTPLSYLMSHGMDQEQHWIPLR